MPADPSDEQLVSYLLHELSPEERARLQEALFADASLLERLRDVENDLIDALARGELPAAEAAKVREFVEATSQRGRLEFAGALARVDAGDAAAQPGKGVGWFSWTRILAPVCVALAVSTAALWVQNQRLRTAVVTEHPAARSLSGGVYSFVVWPGAVRGGEGPLRVKVPAGTAVVEIQLPVPADSGSSLYSVAIATEAGEAVWSQSGKPAKSTDRVTVLVPARVLGPGSYEAELSGGSAAGALQTAGYYYFRVE